MSTRKRSIHFHFASNKGTFVVHPPLRHWRHSILSGTGSPNSVSSAPPPHPIPNWIYTLPSLLVTKTRASMLLLSQVLSIWLLGSSSVWKPVKLTSNVKQRKQNIINNSVEQNNTSKNKENLARFLHRGWSGFFGCFWHVIPVLHHTIVG